MQTLLFDPATSSRLTAPFTSQLLKWIGNKQRFAHEIVSYFPAEFSNYFEPFLGSGAVLGTLAPKKGFASDSFGPLVDIWRTLREKPKQLSDWYAKRWYQMMSGNKVKEYEKIKAAYNANPNGADLLFLCRSCYGGVVRFRKGDGYMSTPCGIHSPIHPNEFADRVNIWHTRTSGTNFFHISYEDAMAKAKAGDLVYCDPPYSHTQTILYGAQEFKLENLFEVIADCKRRGVYVVLSIDGTKKSGKVDCELPVPIELFEREVFVDCGRSMLKRFQMDGLTLEREHVTDRLLLTY
jgi:DNA adenine methylase